MNNNVIGIVLADYDLTRLNTILAGIQSNPLIRVLSFAQDGKTAVKRASEMGADAVLMEYGLLDLDAIEVAEQLRKDSPGTIVFTITDAVSAELIFKAKNAGIAEVYKRDTFIAKDVADTIVEYVQNQRSEYEKAIQEHGKVIKGQGPRAENVVKEYVTQTMKQSIVLSYNMKGGVGKTSVAVNLATAIKMSPYYSGQRVVLVDFDLGGANVSTLCRLDYAETISRNLANWDYADEEIITGEEIEDLLLKGPSGIRIAAAPLNLIKAEDVTLELADKILRILKKHFDVIIIDGAPNISHPIDSALQHATHTLLIANPEGQSVTQLSKIINLMQTQADHKIVSSRLQRMYLVVNHNQPDSEWDLSVGDITKTLGRPLIQEIPYDPIVKKALHGNSNKQAVELEPDSPFSIAIKKLANSICGAYPEGFDSGKAKLINSNTKKKSGIFGLFKK